MDYLTNTSGENIKVIVRIKPNPEGTSKTIFTEFNETNSLKMYNNTEFVFDKLAGCNSTQNELFESSKHLFQSFVDGYNATIFAYGQTGSGKTYTMTGDSDAKGETKNPGLIPRGLEFIFDKVNERALSNSVEYLIKCTFVEIYNEQIYDLLDSQLPKLNLRFNISQEVYVESCSEIVMESPKMAEEILKRGLSNRHMASTEMNRESSRSHAVFTIVLESRESQGDIAKIKKSCLHLVDLAGSERQKDTKSEGIRLKEACMINKSLLALSMVIRKLSEAAKYNKTPFITFRDSKLTMLLKDAIGGNSKTAVVACIHNDKRYISDTCSTLHFATTVKMIVNKAKINVDVHGDNESLRREILFLREKLENIRQPDAIQDHEFDFDLLWKKRFLIAMMLRSHLCNDVSLLNETLVSTNLTNSILMKSVDNLKMDLEMRQRKMKFLEQRFNNENIGEDEIKSMIDKALKMLENHALNLSEYVKSDLLKIEISFLKKKIADYESLDLLSRSDQTLVHSLLLEYNNIIESGDFKDSIKKMDNKSVEIAELKLEMARFKNLNVGLKKKIYALKNVNRDEKRRYESEIHTMKSNLKVVDEQREAAVVDRRQTIIMNPNINCRRRTEKRPKTRVLEDINSSDEFVSSEIFLKENASDLMFWDKVTVLEKQLRDCQIKIGTMEFNELENEKEIKRLENVLLSKETIQDNLKEMEIKYDVAMVALEESQETIKKLQKDNSQLEATKDKTIKILTEKNFNLLEDVNALETEQEIYKEKLERVELSMICLTDQLKEMEETASLLENEKSHLKSQLTQNIVLSKEVTETKNELKKAKKELDNLTDVYNAQTAYTWDLKKSIDEYKVQEKKMNDLILVNEELQETILQLEQSRRNVTTEHAIVIANLGNKFKEQEDILKSDLKNGRIVQSELSEELKQMKGRLEQLEEENQALKMKTMFNSPLKGSPFGIKTPIKNYSSPLAKKLIYDSDSRNSLLDDMIASNNQADQELKEKARIIEMIDKILSELFIELDKPQSGTIVENMATIQAALVSYKHDIEDLIAKKVDVENRLTKQTNMYHILEQNFASTKEQRDKFKRDLDEVINAMPNGGHLNSRQRISYFKQFKDENAMLRSDNMNLVDENNSIRIWLIQNNYWDAFEKRNAGHGTKRH